MERNKGRWRMLASSDSNFPRVYAHSSRTIWVHDVLDQHAHLQSGHVSSLMCWVWSKGPASLSQWCFTERCAVSWTVCVCEESVEQTAGPRVRRGVSMMPRPDGVRQKYLVVKCDITGRLCFPTETYQRQTSHVLDKPADVYCMRRSHSDMKHWAWIRRRLMLEGGNSRLCVI